MKKIFLLLMSLLLAGCFGSGPDEDQSQDQKTEDTVIEEDDSAEEVGMEDSGINVAFPQTGAKVSFPLVITGEARGGWYFEASFPVTLVDSEGTVLAESYAQALDNWMQEGFVPFEATIDSASPNTESGTLIFEMSNMSGMPELDFSVEVPVKF